MEQHGVLVPRLVPYMVAVFLVTFMGGGLILGTGPFVTTIMAEHYVGESQLSSIFEGAFQLLTWGTAFGAHLLSRLGPRITSVIGLLVSFSGCWMLATLPKGASTARVIIPYGLLGWGGNHVFLSAFQFSMLFPERLGVADGMMAGSFNAAGLVFLLFNIPSVTIHMFFLGWMALCGVGLVLVIAFFPDRSYELGDESSLSCPTLRFAMNPFSVNEYVRTFNHLCNWRFVLYTLSFGWSTVFSTYLQGSFVGAMYQNVATAGFLNWGDPIIINATVAFTWIVGLMIDKCGFALAGFAQAALCTSGVVMALIRDTGSFPLWFGLVLINWTQSVQYTIQFAFLHKALAPEAFHVGLVVTLILQGLFALVPTPVLDPNPWGDNYSPPLYLLLACSTLLYVWPIAEMFCGKTVNDVDNNSFIARSTVLSSVS